MARTRGTDAVFGVRGSRQRRQTRARTCKIQSPVRRSTSTEQWIPAVSHSRVGDDGVDIQTELDCGASGIVPNKPCGATKPKTRKNKVKMDKFRRDLAVNECSNGQHQEDDGISCKCGPKISGLRRQWMTTMLTTQRTMQCEIMAQMLHERHCCEDGSEMDGVILWLCAQVQDLQETVDTLLEMRPEAER